MQVTEGQIVTVEAGGERADYVVTGLSFGDAMSGRLHVDPQEMTLLRLVGQGNYRLATRIPPEGGE